MPQHSVSVLLEDEGGQVDVRDLRIHQEFSIITVQAVAGNPGSSGFDSPGSVIDSLEDGQIIALIFHAKFIV